MAWFVLRKRYNKIVIFTHQRVNEDVQRSLAVNSTNVGMREEKSEWLNAII